MKRSFLYLCSAALGLLAMVSCDRAKDAELSGAADVPFARETFERLARGETAVQESIDWKTLQSLGENTGSQYVVMKSEADQRAFRDAFITQFSSSFRESGGKIENFTNWRAIQSDALKSVVAADSPNGVLRITVTERDNMRRVSGFEMVTH